MRTAFRTTVLVAGLLAFLFVFIVPDIPTPEGLVKEQPAMKPIAVAFLGVALGILALQNLGRRARAASHPESILELTCARLC